MALIAHTIKGSTDSNTVTTDPIDTTGADMLIVSVTVTGSATTVLALSDSEANTWLFLGAEGLADFVSTIEFFYCLTPNVGASHTFTYTDTGKKPSIDASAWAGVTAYRSDGGATSHGSTSIGFPNYTPVAIGELCFISLGRNAGGTATPLSGFTVMGEVAPTGTSVGLSLAYRIAPSTSTITPDWTWTGSATSRGGGIAMFDYVEPPNPKNGCFVLGGTVNGASNVDTTRTGYVALDNVARTVSGAGIQFIGGANGFIEQASAPSGIANTALLYAEDNGSGKTRLVVKFGTGSAIVIATEV
jgi:hypothetical protein